jgi:dienelactone hydrolase
MSRAKELDDALANWQLIMYGGAMHGFTHQHARATDTPGVAYHEAADRHSFADASRFLAEKVPRTTADSA